MKVVVTGTRGIPNILGGVETHCEELFPRMVQKDIDITIVRRKSYVHDSLAEYQGVKLVDITTQKKKSLEAVIHTFKAILKARSLHADIVHIHAIGPALLTPLARLLGMQVVFTHHGPDYDRDKWGVAAKTMLKLGERMGVMFANEVIVISEVINDILVRDYGDKEAKVVMNTVGNIFSGQVVGETAKTLSERFGKVLQKRQSISINRQDVSTSINTQMDALIPPSKISGLTQGMFVGSVSDNFNERIEQKIFHCEIVVDAEKVKREEKAYKKIPVITDFTDEDGNDHMKETVQANYRRIKEEVKQIVQEELERIANDDNLKHLLQQK